LETPTKRRRVQEFEFLNPSKTRRNELSRNETPDSSKFIPDFAKSEPRMKILYIFGKVRLNTAVTKSCDFLKEIYDR